MGAANTKPVDSSRSPPAEGCPIKHDNKPSSSACPVNHDNQPDSACPIRQDEKPSSCPVKHEPPKPSSPEGCPVDHTAASSSSSYQHPHVYNVYSQRINPDNQMPSNPNQTPINASQEVPLSTNRIESSIPKGGTSSSWTYPSPQMFYNALVRKGKGDDVSAADMDTVVAIHNNMNERTWKQLLQWEICHSDECSDPRLLRFQGRPNDLTPKAWIKSWFGFGRPFDRHDWFVDRCGTTVRYVIDFYDVVDERDNDQFPLLEDTASVRSVAVDVRPALDSFDAFVERVRHLFSSTGTELEPTKAELNRSSLREDLPPSLELSETDVKAFVSAKCASRLVAFKECGDDPEECGKASVALNYCMGSIVCKALAENFIQKLENGDEAAEPAYEKLTACLSQSDVLKALFSDQ